MSAGGEVLAFECRRASDALHRQIDGDRLDGPTSEWLATHLGDCPRCRRAEAELREIHQALSGLPETPLPDEALEQVWEQTLRSRRSRPAAAVWGVVAAAALILAVVGLWSEADRWTRSGPSVATAEAPTPAEVDRATAELRFALGVTASALQRGERAAVDDVLGRRVAPALGKIPMHLPGRPSRPEHDRDRGEDDV